MKPYFDGKTGERRDAIYAVCGLFVIVSPLSRRDGLASTKVFICLTMCHSDAVTVFVELVGSLELFV